MPFLLGAAAWFVSVLLKIGFSLGLSKRIKDLLQRSFGAAIANPILWPATAMAAKPTLQNKDNRAYGYQLKCGTSVLKANIGALATVALPVSGVCTLTVSGPGSATVQPGMTCVIKKYSLSCN